MKNSEKLEIRGYIKVRCGLGISSGRILKEVHEHFGINSVSKFTVYRWIKLFRSGCQVVILSKTGTVLVDLRERERERERERGREREREGERGRERQRED